MLQYVALFIVILAVMAAMNGFLFLMLADFHVSKGAR